MRISAISGKGGAGKTTAAVLLAGEFALEGKSVLMIDADPRLNLSEWWERSIGKDNAPDGIKVSVAGKHQMVADILNREAAKYDVVIMDAPGVDTTLTDVLIRNSDVVITPVQPAQAEIRAAGEAAMLVAEIGDDIERVIPHLFYRTRISITNRNLEEYRFIRPFVNDQLKPAGYDGVRLMDTELMERNCYREIMTGYGTLQMLELTEPVLKARNEIRNFTTEVLSALKSAA